MKLITKVPDWANSNTQLFQRAPDNQFMQYKKIQQSGPKKIHVNLFASGYKFGMNHKAFVMDDLYIIKLYLILNVLRILAANSPFLGTLLDHDHDLMK